MVMQKKGGRGSNLTKEDKIKGGENSHKSSNKTKSTLSSKKGSKK